MPLSEKRKKSFEYHFINSEQLLLPEKQLKIIWSFTKKAVLLNSLNSKIDFSFSVYTILNYIKNI